MNFLFRNHLLIYFICVIFHFLGFYIYYEGFFKIGDEINIKNKIETPYIQENNWNSPQINRSIIIIIDALRYDFVYSNNKTESNLYYHNKFTILQHLLETEKENTLLIKTYSDPPTVTTQRIKSLMTGNLGSFIEFKDNFSGKEVKYKNNINIFL